MSDSLDSFRWVDGYGLFSTDPNGVVHWLAKPDGTPVVDNYYSNVEGRASAALANNAKEIRI